MRKFKTESKRLLDLMINSIYTNHEIFLRELISNASDALDKLYVASLGEPSVARSDLGIHIRFDRAARILTISDNGIGMDEDSLEKNLGTIAHSGSLEFKDNALGGEGVGSAGSASSAPAVTSAPSGSPGSPATSASPASPVDIIGQFGVGFYSSFMVADKVTVLSRAYGKSEACRWDSNGKDGYTIKPAKRDSHGTDVILHIRESTVEENLERYLDSLSLQALVRRYSNYIRYPISMDIELPASRQTPDDAPDERQAHDESVIETSSQVINSMVPIWVHKKGEVTQEEYNEFYRSDFHDMHDPLRTISVHAEGALEYDALLFIPREIPANPCDREHERGLVLYSSHVLIAENCAKLVPEHYGFVRGIVDSKGISLNISREALQQDHQLELIERHLEKKITHELEDMRDNDRATYVEFFDQFGHSLKHAIYASHGVLTEALNDLLLFYSAKEGRPVTFAEYVEAACADAGGGAGDGTREGEVAGVGEAAGVGEVAGASAIAGEAACEVAGAGEAEKIVIYYATGDDQERLAKTPSVQTVLDRGYDVLLCPGSLRDEFCFMTMGSYKGYDFLNVASATVSMGDDAEKEEARQADKENADLFDTLLENTPAAITRVIASTRLKGGNEAASCIATDGSLTIAMARFLSTRPEREGVPQPKYLLEINTRHKLFASLRTAYELQETERVKDYATVLLNQALLAEDLPIDDPLAFNAAMNALMA